MRVPLIKRRIFEDEQNVLLNPRLQVADGEKDALGFPVGTRAPILTKTSLESFFLTVGWQLRQQ